MMVTGDDDGYADEGEAGASVVVLRPLPPRPEPIEVDEDDAIDLRGFIQQIEQAQREVLHKWFVFYDRRVSREQVSGAIRRLRGAMDENFEAVREMERRLRGR